MGEKESVVSKRESVLKRDSEESRREVESGENEGWRGSVGWEKEGESER